jgi:ABC-type lipoprotein export system ATPase subunit
VRRSFRVDSIINQFNLDENIKEVCERFAGSIDIDDREWQIGAVVGASGTGKTTIARDLFDDNVIQCFDFNDAPIIENMPDKIDTQTITKIFNSVGFATVWSWLKPYSVLSQGEQMRVNLARAILEDRELVVFDEYTSVVNREVAKHGSFALQKAVRKTNKRFVAVTCHADVVDWLEPDWVFNTDTMRFYYGRRLRRPQIRLRIAKCSRDLWRIFGRYHYLNTKIHKGSQCFCAAINGTPVGFFAVLHFPHPRCDKFKRGHRLVVLPDYQGLGIGHELSTAVAEHYHKAGFRFIITSSTRSLFRQRRRDKRWVVKRKGRVSGGAKSCSKSLQKTFARNRLTYSYEFIGSKDA